MFVFNSIKAQNTFTVTAVKADTVTGGTVRATDTLCSTKDLCVHQDAKVSGNVTVTGKVVAKSGILLDTNSVGLFKSYMQVPIPDSTQGSNTRIIASIYAGPLPTPTSPTVSPSPGGGDIPPIDYDPCESGQIIDTTRQEGSGGFIAAGTRSNVVDATVGMYIDWWTGNGMLDLMGKGLYGSDHGLYINYTCGKNVYIGTGFGNGGDWKGKAGSKIFMGDFVNMRKHVEIGDPVWGTGSPNNINLESHCNGGIANIRAKTWTTNTPQLSVFNTNSTGAPYNGRYTFIVYGDGRTMIKSLDNVQPLLSIGQYTSTNSSEAGTENFRVYADGRTWIQSSGTNTPMLTINTGTNDVFKVYGNGKTIIGTQSVVGTHADALLQVAGKAASKSFYVLKPTTWADFVFTQTNELPALNEVEKYVTKYKHLPGMPSDKEILEQGYDINEMDAKLLEHIEKLYLYIIELKKENEKLKESILNINKQMETLNKETLKSLKRK